MASELIYLKSFLSEQEIKLSDQYLKDGFVVMDSASKPSLDYIRYVVVSEAVRLLGCEFPSDQSLFLDTIHNSVDLNNLNQFRLSIISRINNDPKFRLHYFLTAKPYLETLVGNELCMQLRVNLSIQLPGDKNSLLPIHSDTWSGDSPYEVVVWIPLVNCFKSKSMYILNPSDTKDLRTNFSAMAGRNSEELFRSISDKVRFLSLNYGQILIFDQGNPHGNRVNEENETRWSLNCRFKGVFTPYGDKKIGEFFEPVTLRAASRIGMEYQFPEVN